MAVQDQLPGLTSRRGEAEPDEDVVETALKRAQQVLTGDPRLPRCLLVVDPELPLEHTVVTLGLLLLAQLQAILALLLAAASVVSGRVTTALDAALVGQTALALEEQLLTLAAALLALRSGVSCHVRPSSACAGGSRCAPAGLRP